MHTLTIFTLTLVTLALSKTSGFAVSHWKIHFTNQTSEMWRQIREDGFVAEEGNVMWFPTRRMLWLYLYSHDSQSFLYVQIPFKQHLLLVSQKDHSFYHLDQTVYPQYSYYQDMTLIESFNRLTTESRISGKDKFITLKDDSATIQMTLISSQSSHIYHLLFVMFSVPFTCFLLRLPSLCFNEFFNYESYRMGLNIMVIMMKPYWLIFSVTSLYYLAPALISQLFWTFVGFLTFIFTVNLLIIVFHIDFFKCSTHSYVRRFLIGYLVFMVLKTLLTFSSLSSFASLSVTHVLVYSLSPLFLIIHNKEARNDGELIYSYFAYLLDMYYICYFMGCPSNLLHHPQYPNVVLFILIINVFFVIMIFEKKLRHYFRLFYQWCRHNCVNQIIKEPQTHVCKHCDSSTKFDPAGVPYNSKIIVQGTDGNNFHRKCLQEILNNTSSFHQEQMGSSTELVVSKHDST